MSAADGGTRRGAQFLPERRILFRLSLSASGDRAPHDFRDLVVTRLSRVTVMLQGFGHAAAPECPPGRFLSRPDPLREFKIRLKALPDGHERVFLPVVEGASRHSENAAGPADRDAILPERFNEVGRGQAFCPAVS